MPAFNPFQQTKPAFSLVLGSKSLFYLLFVGFVLQLQGCISYPEPLKVDFDASKVPSAPDYANPATWVALPNQKNGAHFVPKGTGFQHRQADAPADVFFVHPTTNNRRDNWNGRWDDKKANNAVRRYVLPMQASAFNGAGKVYAPHYRQLHVYALLDTSHWEWCQAAKDTAYGDVKRAFYYFLANHNQGRPFFLASHSQGSVHLTRLLREEIQGTPLQDQLVAAYLIGNLGNEYLMKFPEKIPVCQYPGQTGCWLTFNTYQENAAKDLTSRLVFTQAEGRVVNPLSWTTDTIAIPAAKNPGSINILGKFRSKPTFGARIADGVVYTDNKRPPLYLQQLSKLKGDYHIMDYGLYYASIRKNAEHRLQEYLQQQSAKQHPAGEKVQIGE
jgi:hypothetical protein